LRDLHDLESAGSNAEEQDISVALESISDLKSLVVSGRAELDTMIGSLQNYMTEDSGSPF
jgi:hypothetical protein